MDIRVEDYEKYIKSVRIDSNGNVTSVSSTTRKEEVRRASSYVFTRRKTPEEIDKNESKLVSMQKANQAMRERNLSTRMQLYMQVTKTPEKRAHDQEKEQEVISLPNDENDTKSTLRVIKAPTIKASDVSEKDLKLNLSDRPMVRSTRMQRYIQSVDVLVHNSNVQAQEVHETSGFSQIDTKSNASNMQQDLISKSIKNPLILEDEKIEIPAGHEKYKDITRTDEEVEKIADIISRNVQKRIKKDDRIFRKELRKKGQLESGNQTKKTILGPKKTKTRQRLTEPKERSFLKRLMLRWGYNAGYFDFIKEAYKHGQITPEYVEELKNGTTKSEKREYKEIQAYEDVVSDVSMKRGWIAFKAGLAAVLLAVSLGVTIQFANEMKELISPPETKIVTILNADESQLENARNKLGTICENTEYEFNNLTEDELIDGVLRIPVIEEKINLNQYKNAMYNFRDQEFLEEILQETYGEEYNTFSEDKKEDLKQLAYELLGDQEDKQFYMRDPQRVKEAKEKQLSKKQSDLDDEIGIGG